MGYACPVCGDPQADGEHLANHLAFTAMLGDADHEDWLDEHAPDWADTDPAELAARVTDHADEREFPQVFEDTTGDGQGNEGRGHHHDSHGHSHDGHGNHDHSHPGRGHGIARDVAPGGVADPAELVDGDGDDGDESPPSDVLAEARELTQERRTNAGPDDESAPTDGDSPTSDDDDVANADHTEDEPEVDEEN